MTHSVLNQPPSSPSESHTIIIGAGVIGLGIAWRLAQHKRQVTVLDKAQPGSGASGAAAGMLAPLAEIDYVECEAVVALKQESLRRYPAFCAELEAASGIKVDYRRSGTLMTAIDRDDTEKLRHHFEHRRRMGLKVAWLTGDEARAIEPWLSPYIQAAIDIPSDHQVDNGRLVEALAEAARSSGAQIITEALVERIEHDGAKVEGVTFTVDSEEVFLGADNVVVAAGCWSRTLGLDADLAPPVRPVKGQMFSVKMPERPILDRVVRTFDCYLVPRSDGRLLVGATSEERGFDTELTAGAFYDLLRGAYEALPGIYELPIDRTWAGLRPASLDNDPILGHTRLAGLLMATGHYRNGILLTPVTADTVCEAILTGRDPELIAPLNLSRFA